jgi:serine/threonine-protein kinase HipA
MRTALVYRNNDLAGKLTESEREYIFRYDDFYFRDQAKKAISLTLPKIQQEYRSKIFFPFFFNMLAEGVNKKLQCRQLQIDENDYFSLLTKTAGEDTIGCITVKAESL